MDIRTKLVFALVAVALGSMLLLGSIMYDQASRILLESTQEQFEGLAESRRDAVAQLVDGWKERVQLIASRTQLRLSLRDVQTPGAGGGGQARMQRILTDASRSVRSIEALAVYGRDGTVIASSERDLESEGASAGPDPVRFQELDGLSEQAVFAEVVFPNDGPPRVAFVAGLILDGEPLGTLYAELAAAELVRLTRDFAGLGATGEVMIAARDGSGDARLLHPVRHPHDDGAPPAVAADPADPVRRALDGEESFQADGVSDYRGEPIWAATRHLPDVGWGLVVKFDAAEKREPLLQFRRRMINVGLSLGAFAILAGTALGIAFARPIQALAETAGRIRDGELGARARVTSEDEVGMLARSFNQMADQLEERLELLRQFHTFFEASRDMLCIAGTDGYFKRTNPAFERVLGWTDEELLSKPFVEFVHPDDVEATIQEVTKLGEGIPTISFTNRYRCADGTYATLRWTAHPDPETGRIYAIARRVATDPDGP